MTGGTTTAFGRPLTAAATLPQDEESRAVRAWVDRCPPRRPAAARAASPAPTGGNRGAARVIASMAPARTVYGRQMALVRASFPELASQAKR
jgi:hypothetical protein